MVRTQVQLPESDFNRLREVARQLDRSVSDCVREGIGLFLSRTPATVDFSRLREGFAPVADDDPTSLDSLLAEAILQSKQG